MNQEETNLKKGLLPIILLLIVCLMMSVWVWKNVPIKNVDVAEMQLETLDLEALLAEGKPVLLNVSSDDCMYCVIMKPDLEEIYTAYSDVAVIRDVNIDQYPEAAWLLPVRSTPMQVLYNADGTPYEPSEAVWQQMNFLYYTRDGENKHIMTVHEGLMTEEQMELVLRELGEGI